MFRWLVILALTLCSVPGARADIDVEALPDITDRDYAIDVHHGVAFGSGRTIGMGGVGVATAQGSAEMAANPAAVAIRAQNSVGAWDWDWRFDTLTDFSNDFDNNGIKTERIDSPLLGLGFGAQYGKWGFGFDVTTMSNDFDPTKTDLASQDEDLTMQMDIARMAIARHLFFDITFGVSIQIISFDFVAGDGQFDILSGSMDFGTIWTPKSLNLRAGMNITVAGSDQDVTANCDPLDCAGFVLPEEIAIPWQFSTGVAWRFADSKWNQPIDKKFIDERQLTVAANVIVTGPSERGHSFEAMGLKKLQRTGRKTTVSVRGGAEMEVLPGRLRLRGGSYWEPSRVSNVKGRLHGTAGADVRIWSFNLWGPRRLRASATVDLARSYTNIGISAGFWR